MKVSSERIEGCQVVLNVEAEPDEMERALDEAYRRLRSRITVPGFRKGKAPRAILERHIGKESLEAEALEHLVPELYDRAVDQEEVDAIGQPELEMIRRDPPIFKATVPVRPIVELGDYRSIRITPEKVELTDEMIEDALDQLRRIHASWEPVEREARYGDLVVLDIEGTVSDTTILDRKGTVYPLKEGAGTPVPGFPEQIVGMGIGEEKEFNLPLPDDYQLEDMAGKECHFIVSLSEVKQEVLPDLNDEFVKSLGEDVETLEQLREKVAKDLKTTMERDARAKLENDVIEAVVACSKVEYPAILAEQEIDHMANDHLMRLGGMKLEVYLGYRGMTEEDFRNELRPMADRRVRTSLVLNKIHEVESISVSETEVDAEVDRLLEGASDEAEKLREMLSSPQAREMIHGRLLTEKTLKFLVDLATGDVGESSPEEAVQEEKEAETQNQPSAEEGEDDSSS